MRTAYHESGHALIARAYGRKVEEIAVSPDGGFVKEEPLAPNGTPEEIERGLVVLFAGQAAESYAPRSPSPDALAAAVDNGGIANGLVATANVIGSTPSDETLIEHYRERIGEEAVERARALAVELIERKAQLGVLQQLADELYWRGAMTGDDLERILATPV